jgi:hypothetical protein
MISLETNTLSFFARLVDVGYFSVSGNATSTLIMWIIRISLDLYGDNFSPRKALKEITDNIQISSSNEPDDLNDKDPDGVYGFGSLSILSPQIYGLQYEMAEYEEWYLNFIEKYKPVFDKHGVTAINLFFDVFDNGGQLNFEILSRELLKKVGQYEIAIPISVYRLTTEQIVDMLSVTTMSQEKLKQYVEDPN